MFNTKFRNFYYSQAIYKISQYLYSKKLSIQDSEDSAGEQFKIVKSTEQDDDMT